MPIYSEFCIANKGNLFKESREEHEYEMMGESRIVFCRELFNKPSDPFGFLQNDIDDVVGVFFSVDADEEKHILYEKTEVLDSSSLTGDQFVTH